MSSEREVKNSPTLEPTLENPNKLLDWKRHASDGTSSGEKKATASGSLEPAGCNDTTARKIEGQNNSMMATLSEAVGRAELVLSLFKV